MNAETISSVGMVTRHWRTGVVIGRVNLDGIISNDPAAGVPANGERRQSLPSDSIPGLRALEEEFLAAMNALAAADEAAAVTESSISIQAWRDGYDEPAFACQARYAGWIILAASQAPRHSESGCLTFADPRAGSAMTAMPGLPFGRQFLLRPVPGACAVAPGWLTSSVVPLEPGQHITVAVSTGT